MYVECESSCQFSAEFFEFQLHFTRNLHIFRKKRLGWNLDPRIDCSYLYSVVVSMLFHVLNTLALHFMVTFHLRWTWTHCNLKGILMKHFFDPLLAKISGLDKGPLPIQRKVSMKLIVKPWKLCHQTQWQEKSPY